MCNSMLKVLKNTKTIFKVTAAFETPAKSIGGFHFLHIVANTHYHPSFYYNHPRVYEVVSHGSGLHFPMTNDVHGFLKPEVLECDSDLSFFPVSEGQSVF